MKTQVIILLSLLCFQAFSAFTESHSASLGGTTFQLGTEDNGDCCIQTSDASSTYCYAGNTASGDCTPKGIFGIGSNAWVVLQVTAGGALLFDGNSATTTEDEYSNTLVPLDGIVANTVIIGRVVTTAGATFGKFNWASYIAASDGAGAWSGYTVTATDSCSNTIELTGNVATGFTLTNQAGVQANGVTGNGVFLAFNTANNQFNGLTTSQCNPPPGGNDDDDDDDDDNGNGGNNGGDNDDGEEEEEEEEDGGNGASILSVTSLMLALAGYVAL